MTGAITPLPRCAPHILFELPVEIGLVPEPQSFGNPQDNDIFIIEQDFFGNCNFPFDFV